MPFALSAAWRRTSSWKFVLPPSTIVSPGSRCSSSSSIWASVASPAGTMTQTARGFSSFATSSAMEKDGVGALAGDLGRLLRRPVVDDDLVAVAEQPADHVGAHPAEADEADAHRGSCLLLDVEGRGQRPLEGGESGVGVGAEVDPHDRQVVGLDGGEVARGLGVDELAEGVRPVGDRAVARVVRGQLEEPADRRAALVELAGRVQEARAVAGGRRPAGPVAQERPDPGDRRVARRRRGDEGLEREIGVRACAAPGGGPARPTSAAVAGGEPERRVAVDRRCRRPSATAGAGAGASWPCSSASRTLARVGASPPRRSAGRTGRSRGPRRRSRWRPPSGRTRRRGRSGRRSRCG